MLAVSYIYETSEGFFIKHNAFFINPVGFMVDTSDFDKIACMDWVKALENKGVDTYVFLGGGNRLSCFVMFLNTWTDIRFYILNHPFLSPNDTHVQMLSKWGNIPKYTLNQLHKDYRYQYKNKMEQRQLDFLTGHYSQLHDLGTVYDVMVSEEQLIDVLSSNLLQQFAINAIIYVKSSDQINQSNPFVLKVLNQEDLLKDVISLTEKEAYKAYQRFVKNGDLPVELKRGILDLNTLLHQRHFNRLFISTKGIYMDYQKKRLLTENYTAGFNELKEVMDSYTALEKPLRYYDTFASLMKSSNRWRSERSIHFYLLDEADDDSSLYTHFVGIENGFECLLFNTQTHKAFSVTKNFLEQFSKFPKIKGVDHMKLLLKEKFV